MSANIENKYVTQDQEIIYNIKVRNPNSKKRALEKIQDAFEGEAERLGLETEEDVVNMIKGFRKERK